MSLALKKMCCVKTNALKIAHSFGAMEMCVKSCTYTSVPRSSLSVLYSNKTLLIISVEFAAQNLETCQCYSV